MTFQDCPVYSSTFQACANPGKKTDHNINVFLQTPNLVVNPITVDNLAFNFNCMPVGVTSDSLILFV